MSDFGNQWVEVFRAGDYGDKGKWTVEDLDEVVANFLGGVWTPPAVFGHPKEDDPAQGWVCALERVGDTLRARFTQVSEELESSVKNGRFPNRSAAFYVNPKGNGPALRHVGFLGATPPEVKGLEPINFSDADFVDIEFSEETRSHRREQTQMKTRSVLMSEAEKNGGLLFGESARIAARDPHLNGAVSVASIRVNDRAQEIKRERNCDFGLALQLARREIQFAE
jgi:hypothetical protein